MRWWSEPLISTRPGDSGDAQNNIVGMDVDIAKELASDDVLKVKLTLVPVPTTQDRINFLLSGKIDVAISNFTATLRRGPRPSPSPTRM